MTRARYILPALILALAAALPGRASAASTEEKDNYERLLAILLTGNAANKTAAKEGLRGMGDAGLELLKADCADPDSVRGALAWSVLREFLIQADVETLRDFARKNLPNVARDWNAAYKGKADRVKQTRLKDLASDYVALLISSDKPKDFELLLKTLKCSLVVADQKADFGAEFEIWKRIWDLLAGRIAASESVRDLQSWQAVLDEHFRRYSLMKNYTDRKAIQAYHTTTLQLMQRIEAVRKKPAPAPAPADEEPVDLTKPKPAEPKAKPAPAEEPEGAAE